MEDKKMTEKESLELITAMIQRTRERYVGDGNIMLMWGYLTVAVTALVWILLVKTGNPIYNLGWFLIPLLGNILKPLMDKKQKVKSGVKSYSDRIVTQIWTVVGISSLVAMLTCFGFIFFAHASSNIWKSMFIFALIMVPMAEIAHGIVVKEKSLVVGGALGLCVGIFTMCCIAAGITFGANWYLPLFIVAFICMMIIPGHIINHKAKQQR